MVPPPEDMPPTPKDQENRKTTTTTTRPAPEQGIKCPRCDSPNTKFCYYNNYSLTQPRHFCKTCRRYWTNGGALRNVPIGGGCRKNKRVKSSSSSSSSSSRLSSEFTLQGLTVPPSVEFSLGALPFPSRLNTHHNQSPIPPSAMLNHFSSFGEVSATNALSGFQLNQLNQTVPSNSLMGLAPSSADMWCRSQSSPLSDPLNSAMQSLQSIQSMQSINVHSSLASSIESLSNINQDLHLKLQQQRLATMIFGGDSQKGDDSGVSLSQQPVNGFENQKLLQPVMFQSLEISKKPENLPAGSSVTEGPSGETVTAATATPTEWFFGNSFPSVTPSTSNGGDNNDGNNNWSGALAWGNLQQQQFSALP